MTLVRRGNKLWWLGLRIRRQAPRLRRAGRGFGAWRLSAAEQGATIAARPSADV